VALRPSGGGRAGLGGLFLGKEDRDWGRGYGRHTELQWGEAVKEAILPFLFAGCIGWRIGRLCRRGGLLSDGLGYRFFVRGRHFDGFSNSKISDKRMREGIENFD